MTSTRLRSAPSLIDDPVVLDAFDRLDAEMARQSIASPYDVDPSGDRSRVAWTLQNTGDTPPTAQLAMSPLAFVLLVGVGACAAAVVFHARLGLLTAW